MKIDKFMMAMLACIALALVIPDLGASAGPLKTGLLTDIGIALVFFLHGVETSREAVIHGARNWKLHALVHLTTFVIFPLVGLGIYFGLGTVLSAEERAGLFFLCCLPSTISTSVAMTGIAGGNVPAAVFAATTSGLIGMVLTPLLFGFVVNVTGHGLALGPAFLDIFLKLLAPFVVGHLARPLLAATVHRHKKLINTLDRSVIVLIVFASFSDATMAGTWRHITWPSLLLLSAITAALLVLALVFTTRAGRIIGLDRADRITAIFCGSKKSLANGAPIARALLGAHADLALLILPLILYHQEQLIVGSALARRYARDTNRAAPVVQGTAGLNPTA